MKKTLSIILLLVITTSIVLAEISPTDVQKIVREENKRTIDELMVKLEAQKKSTIDEIYALANKMAGDFQKIVTDTEKKIILISGVSLIGIILLTEGILGFIRIRKEQNVLLVLKKDINYLKDSHDALKAEFLELKNKGIKQVVVTETIEVNKIERERLEKINKLKEELKDLEQKTIDDFTPKVINKLKEGEEDLVVPQYPKKLTKEKKGWFGRKKKVKEVGMG